MTVNPSQYSEQLLMQLFLQSFTTLHLLILAN